MSEEQAFALGLSLPSLGGGQHGIFSPALRLLLLCQHFTITVLTSSGEGLVHFKTVADVFDNRVNTGSSMGL